MTIRKIVSRSIGTDVIAAEDLAANSVTVAEIQDGAVTEAKIGSGAVTGAKIGDTEVSAGKLASTLDLSSNTVTLPDESVTADKLNVGQIGGRRNIIINGAMEVAQRATSVSGSTASGYLTVDRFRANASGATFNMSQESLTAGQTDIPQNFKKFLRFNPTTSNDYAGIRYYHEDVETVQGDVTVSFYAKGTNPADGYVSFSMSQNFGSGGSTEVEQIGNNDFTLTSSWQRFTFNVSMPSISGKTVGAGSFVRLNWWQEDSASTDAWTIDITGVQLEYGTVATPFEHRSYGEELALCQRYCQVATYDAGIMASGTNYNTTSAVAYVPLIQPMRTAPTINFPTSGQSPGNITFIQSSGNWSTAFGSNTPNAITNVGYIVSGTSYGGFTAQTPAWLYVVSNGTQITADAEL